MAYLLHMRDLSMADASLLQTCAALATALANNRELPPKAITSALKLHGFFVACVSRSMVCRIL